MTHVTIIGNTVAEPEERTTPKGAKVTSFRVAVNERVRQDDGTRVDGEATYYNVSAWDPIAEGVAEKVSKGTRVIVHGKLKSRSYEGKDGQKGLSLDVRADEVGISTGLTRRNGTKPDNAQTDSWDTPF